MSRTRLLMAGLVAFLVGMPLTEKVVAYDYGSTVDIIGASATLALSLVNASAGGS
ncbi:MAG: hypothetical protein KA354_07365 [Phycisphaerae bacterium]|nr:hypothetical protein [Phycisphaerae bacterium]